MRWYWIDRFLEFESGRFAKAVKSVSLSEDYLNDHFSGHPIMPQSLVIEGIAQAGGLLAFENRGFAEKVILAKIPRAEFYFDARPGELLTYTVRLESCQANGSVVNATSHVADRLQAELEVMFVHLDDIHDDAHEATLSFDHDVFLEMMRVLGAFDVGRASDGGPLAGMGLVGAASSQPSGNVDVGVPRSVASPGGPAQSGVSRRNVPR